MDFFRPYIASPAEIEAVREPTTTAYDRENLGLTESSPAYPAEWSVDDGRCSLPPRSPPWTGGKNTSGRRRSVDRLGAASLLVLRKSLVGNIRIPSRKQETSSGAWIKGTSGPGASESIVFCPGVVGGSWLRRGSSSAASGSRKC